ncbi:uncharacterized protein LOC112560061 isoform X2 [Pomacea canaliculata]|uniref:uncharacterized protein LOC112560061 isoform X2 n=1 Tax=Pomacea canaliculata TaxID=400727 RepID=UPI000D72CFCE|nr:uncharacterized protein LOC112560061 isoform X2 [Pomacea canaliculata]
MARSSCQRWIFLVIVFGLNACWSAEEIKPRLIVRSRVVRRGDKLTLGCELISSSQYYMNLQHKPFNGKDFSEVQNQINEEEELESGQGYRLTSELTVQNAMTEDSGQYRCFVKIANDQQIEGSPESVFVVGSDPLILLEKKAPLLLKKGIDLNITCVGVAPIEWIRPKDEEVQSGDLGQSYVISGPLKIVESKQIYRRILHVHNITCAQAGRYVCRTSVSSNDSAISDATGASSGRNVTSPSAPTWWTYLSGTPISCWSSPPRK